MSEGRARPQPSAWRILAEDFREAAKLDFTQMVQELDPLELRAGKLLAACVEAGIAPPEYPITRPLQAVRGELADAETERGWTPANCHQARTGLAVWLSPAPPPKFEAGGPHFLVVVVWLHLALVWLPERYPDHFRDPQPTLEHPLNRLEGFDDDFRTECGTRALGERARHFGEAALLMADLCGAAGGTTVRRVPRGAPVRFDPKSDRELIGQWERARDAGLSREDFCSDRGLQVKDLEAAQRRERARLQRAH